LGWEDEDENFDGGKETLRKVQIWVGKKMRILMEERKSKGKRIHSEFSHDKLILVQVRDLTRLRRRRSRFQNPVLVDIVAMEMIEPAFLNCKASELRKPAKVDVLSIASSVVESTYHIIKCRWFWWCSRWWS